METTQSSNQKTNNDWRNNKIMEEEQLIEEVHKRPPLWNFKLPLVERSLHIKKKLWKEIYISMNGTMDIPTIKKKWKSLCDSFRIHNRNKHQPSSTGTRKGNWVHFERMQFLCDVQLEKETTMNISVSESNEKSNNSVDDSIYDGSSTSGRESCNYKRRIDDTNSLDRFVGTLSQPVTINMLPSASSPDKITLFGNLIVSQLREVDPQLVDRVMLQIMKVINAAKKNHN